MEDQEIIALFWNRDNSAIHAAQEKYGGSLLHLTERLLHSPQDAEECVNDACLCILLLGGWGHLGSTAGKDIDGPLGIQLPGGGGDPELLRGGLFPPGPGGH